MTSSGGRERFCQILVYFGFLFKDFEFCIFSLNLNVNDSSEGDKVIIMVHKNNNYRDSKSIFIGRRVRLIKCSYNALGSVRLMSIPVINS